MVATHSLNIVIYVIIVSIITLLFMTINFVDNVLAGDGNILIKELPAGGATLIGTTDSADWSTIALGYSTKTRSFYTGALEHPCVLDTNIYGTEYDTESITKGQAMHFSWDESKGETVCKWMKAWPMHSDFLMIPSTRSHIKGTTKNSVFIASRLSNDISAPTFDFKCTDTDQSVLGKGDSFVMKINGESGECLWTRKVPNWNVNMKGVFLSAVTRHPSFELDQSWVYFSNVATVQGAILNYGNGKEYIVSGAAGKPESFVVALAGADGSAQWLRPFTVNDVASAMPTALASYRDADQAKDMVYAIAYVSTSAAAVTYPIDGVGGTLNVDELPTDVSFHGKYLMLLLDGNSGYVKEGTHFGSLLNSKNYERSLVTVDSGKHIHVAVPYSRDTNKFLIRQSKRGDCTELSNISGNDDIALFKFDFGTLQCKYAKRVASYANDELYGLTFNSQDYDIYGVNDVVELFAKVGTNFQFNGDDSVEAFGETRFRVKVKANEGIFLPLVDMTLSTDYIYTSNVENSDIIASGVEPGTEKLLFVSDKCLPGQYKDGSTCKLCSAGTYSNTFGATSCMTCTGTVNDAKTRCTIPDCPVGQFKNTANGNCEDCPKGEHQDQTGQSTCKRCDAETNSYQDQIGQSSCKKCITPGSIVNADRTSCDPCSVGTYSSADGSQCLQCPVGQFQDKTGQSQCIKCPSGRFQMDSGQSECRPCSEIDSNAYQQAEGSDMCEFCPGGSGVSFDRTSCAKCAVNMFSANGAQCQKCPTGKKQELEGQKECMDDDATAAGRGEGFKVDVSLAVGLGVGIPVLLVAAGIAVVGTVVIVGRVAKGHVQAKNARGGDGGGVDGSGDDIPLQEISVHVKDIAGEGE